MSIRKNIIAVIPAYNEDRSIASVVRGVFKNKQVKKCIIVDDCSKDATAMNAKREGAFVIKNPIHIGSGRSLLQGINYAINRYKADIVVTLDGDGQHDPNDINILLSALSKKTDLVIGSRYIEPTITSTSKLRVLGTKLISKMIQMRYKRKIYDVTSGFRAMTKRTAHYILTQHLIVFPEPEVVISLIEKGFNINEVSIRMKRRQYGHSSINIYMAWLLFGYISKKIFSKKLS